MLPATLRAAGKPWWAVWTEPQKMRSAGSRKGGKERAPESGWPPIVLMAQAHSLHQIPLRCKAPPLSNWTGFADFSFNPANLKVLAFQLFQNYKSLQMLRCFFRVLKCVFSHHHITIWSVFFFFSDSCQMCIFKDCIWPKTRSGDSGRNAEEVLRHVQRRSSFLAA